MSRQEDILNDIRRALGRDIKDSDTIRKPQPPSIIENGIDPEDLEPDVEIEGTAQRPSIIEQVQNYIDGRQVETEEPTVSPFLQKLYESLEKILTHGPAKPYTSRAIVYGERISGIPREYADDIDLEPLLEKHGTDASFVFA